MSLFSRGVWSMCVHFSRRACQQASLELQRKWWRPTFSAVYKSYVPSWRQQAVSISSNSTSLSSSTNSEALQKVVEEINERRHQQGKLFVVVFIGGRQFKVTPNDLIVVNQIEADVGDQIYLEKVLLAGSEDFTLIGRPLLSKELVRVQATVVEHTKTAKVIVFKKKRRKNYKRKHGHRQPVSVLRINNIYLDPSTKLN